MEQLSSVLKQKARLELNENEEFVPEAISKFQVLLDGNADFISPE